MILFSVNKTFIKTLLVLLSLCFYELGFAADKIADETTTVQAESKLTQPNEENVTQGVISDLSKVIPDIPKDEPQTNSGTQQNLSKEDLLQKIEPRSEYSYIPKIEPISPDGDSSLIKYWLRLKNGVDPQIAKHDFSKLGLSGNELVKKVRIDADPVELETYRAILKGIEKAGLKNEISSELLLLRADLNLTLAFNGSKDYYKRAFDDYVKFISDFPESKQIYYAVYNLGYIYLKAGDYMSSVELVNKYEGRWKNDKRWSSLFRSLVMESYYVRKRYIKTEDYLWNLANSLEKDELSQHLALRYSDALFWQKKYLAVVEWQKNESVTKFYDASKPWVQVSELYLAESFFQIRKYEEALSHFKKFKETYKQKYAEDLLDFRVLQCEMMISQDYKSYIPLFYNFSLKKRTGELQDSARIQWARLIAKESSDGQAIISEAHAIVTALLTQIEDLHLIKETIYVKGLLSYRLGEYRSALDNISKIYPRRYINSLEGPFLKAVGNFAVYLLEKIASSMWEKHQTIDFLVLTDRFTFAIQATENKANLLYWVGRAYVENGMTGSAIHIFEKLLKEMDAPHRVRTTLELAKAYGLIGDTEAMGKALSLIKTPPSPADERELYFLTKATYQMATKNYAACAEDMNELLIQGVQGDSLFKYALEGAVCARKAKEFDLASRLISLLNLQPEDLKSGNIPTNIKEWYQKGLFEKINLLAETGNHKEAIDAFNHFKEKDGNAHIEIPLETVFLVIDSMRKTQDPDGAIEIWKQYASKTKNLPEGFGDQFTRLLELLASTELLPLPEAAP